MEPRSVVINRSNETRVHYTPQIISPWLAGSTPAALSQLYDIVSDNVRKPRPIPPRGYRRAKEERERLYFKRNPKQHEYKKLTVRYPNGNMRYCFGTNPDAYPQYEQIGTWVLANVPVVSTERNQGVFDAADRRIKSKFFSKLKSTELDLALTVAEASKTKVMISRAGVVLLNCKKWAKAFWKRVRARSIHRHESIAKALAGAWLEFQYGWRQLANDIFGVVSYSAAAAMRRTVKVRSKGGTTIDRSSIDPNSGVVISSQEDISVWSEISAELHVSATPLVDLARLASLNPLAIAWELVPYSFVFDWILNISQYLSELQTRCTFNTFFSNGYLTHVEKHELRTLVKRQKARGAAYCVTINADVKCGGVWVFKQRSKLGEIPRPSLPTLKSPVSLTHALTTLSLITQRLSPRSLGRDRHYQ